MFEVKDECAIPVPYTDKCGQGFTECLGKECKKYVIPRHLADRFQRETEMHKWENDVLELQKKITQRKIDLKIVEPVETVEPVIEPIPDEIEDKPKRGRPAK